MNFLIESIPDEDDPQAEEPIGYLVNLVDEDGTKLLTTFGDDYHDKGSYKARAFCQGYAQALGD